MSIRPPPSSSSSSSAQHHHHHYYEAYCSYTPASSLQNLEHTTRTRMVGGHGRTRSMSISDAIERGRRRAHSVTATEVVETLKAPISYRLVVSSSGRLTKGGG